MIWRGSADAVAHITVLIPIRSVPTGLPVWPAVGDRCQILRGENPATPVEPLVTLWHGDCLDIIPALPDASVDLLLTDPPYGSGELSWDEQPNLPALWTELRRIMKPNSRQLCR